MNKDKEQDNPRKCCELCYMKTPSGLIHCTNIAFCPCHDKQQGIKIKVEGFSTSPMTIKTEKEYMYLDKEQEIREALVEEFNRALTFLLVTEGSTGRITHNKIPDWWLNKLDQSIKQKLEEVGKEIKELQERFGDWDNGDENEPLLIKCEVLQILDNHINAKNLPNPQE